MKTALLSTALMIGLVSSSAIAGQWTCDTGLDGKMIYHLVVPGDADGKLGTPAIVSVAGMGGGRLAVLQDQAQSDELTRVIIGGSDPRSKTLFRIMREPTSPGVYPAHSLLVNFAIKQEFEGICSFAP